MKDKVFGVLQRVGRSFMLPVAILPVAGLLLGLGSSFTNETTLAQYHLTGIMGPGTILYYVFTVMSRCGGVIFDNLPLIFAIGVAIGMARQEKSVAALAAAVSFLVMHSAISAMIGIYGGSDSLMKGATASVLGITSLQMGAFGGIIVGLGVASLHNRFYKIELPQVISFFGGTRFVPIISAVVYLFVGIAMFYIWQPVQTGINALGTFVYSSGYFGTFLFGLIKRLLIPFGLHHVFYLPFWQTAVGGTAVVAGHTVSGAQNIFFAQLADPTVTHFSTAGTWCFTGEFVLYIFGFPGAALAMYRNARPERRKMVGGLLLSAALTSILTGITEPLEFSFLFVAPLLFLISGVFAGLAYMICHILNITVGLTFSGGFIDLFLFGILQGNSKTSWLLIIPVGIVFFLVYYFVFSFFIKKFNYKTPGREEGEEETKLYTKADYNNRKNENGTDQTSAMITQGLGGADNIKDVDCCATRLRVTVNQPELVKKDILSATGAAGVVQKGEGVQVIYGPQVNIIKSHLEDYLSSDHKDEVVLTSKKAVEEANVGHAESSMTLVKTMTFASPMQGEVAPISASPDQAFAEKMMGDGVTIIPNNGDVVAPCDATIEFVFDTKHAIGLKSEDGIELMIHVGIDTVNLNGDGFETFVKAGDQVKKGEKLLHFDLETIREKVPSVSSPVICTSLEDNQKLVVLPCGQKHAGDAIFEIEVYQ
jgi:PTS system D-glucosamine-specific IIC component